MGLTAAELAAAWAVLEVLTQEKYRAKMYLFLQPFDVAEVPGYFDVVPHKRMLDVQTVSAGLAAYDAMADFWRDAAGIFENAIAYHQDRDTKWIAKLARDMLKVLRAEQRRREAGAPGAAGGADADPKRPVSLKLKLPTRSSAAASDAASAASAAPLPDVAADAAAAAAAAAAASNASVRSTKSEDKKAAKAKPKQPKLKLKLSLGTKLKKEPGTATKPAAAAPAGKPKISLKLGSGSSTSRGKELPEGVDAATAEPPTKKPKKAAAAGPSANNRSSKPGGPLPAAQALKVLNGLRRRQSKSIAWFLQPVSDKAILADYRAKVKHPSDISTVTAKVERGAYSSVAGMVLDLRRIFANCLVYNTSIKDSLRPVAVEVLETAEELLKVFFQDVPGSYPPLLYCWKLCVGVLDTLYNLTNPTDGLPTVLYFLHPVSYYCGGQFPPDYLEAISKPMDFGTVTSKLIEAKYSSVEEFCSDCRLVLTNCMTYYEGRADGLIFVEQANRLNVLLSQQIEQLRRYVRGSRAAADEAKANAPVVLPQPPPPLLLNVLQELRAISYTDKATKISEPLTGPFEKPVSLTTFPDYLSMIAEPMDLSQVERKAKAGAYLMAEDFEYDVNLTFKNCEKYNAARGGDHLVTMSKHAARQFRKIFYSSMKMFEDPGAASQVKQDQAYMQTDEAVANKDSFASSMNRDDSNANRGKATPRISITAAQLSVAAATAKSPQSQKKSTPVPDKSNQPVPLHIAIARVKEAFPLRRQIKGLQPWEADCAKYFKELMRHPWISATRPQYIFHVPVPKLFPELREAYEAKVRKPMDLTTIECTLLAGNKYATPEDFVHDIALVFANAVRFNRDGKDVGDPLSCAYYDASIHLLRYSRWLSMELLAQYIDNSEHVDEDNVDGLPPFSWRLTEGNRTRAREEMEKLVFGEPIDKSLEGDRYTWQESECEKLLKALRHQSDLRHMTFFIQPNYPADYTAFISRPMDWEKVNRTLRKRHYDKFGDIVADLRLIFSNALKYNGRLKGTDTVSGRAYEAATIMNVKLESAINKMLLTVSDRLERERIDHNNAEREIEAADRAEEARIRAAWKKEPDAINAEGDGQVGAASALHSPDAASYKIRIVRRAAQRRDATDFEIPYFDEENDGKHEQSHFEVIKFQKAMFQKLRQEQVKMRQRTNAIGSLVFMRMLQNDLASKWEENELEKAAIARSNEADHVVQHKANDNDADEKVGASAVLKELEREGRNPLQLKLADGTKPRKKRKHPGLLLE